MCLITFAYRQHPDYPLILVSNRDEFFARPSREAHFWEQDPSILAGIDLEQMGTWLGISTTGKFAAVTNFRSGQPIDPQLKSRGHLTTRFLAGNTSASDYLEAFNDFGAQFGGANLLLGDHSGLFYGSNKGGEPSKLAPGIYGLSNAYLDTPWPKVKAAKSKLAAALKGDLSPQILASLLHSSAQAPDDQLPDTGINYDWEKLLSSIFINSEHYGTRATTVLLQDNDGIIAFSEFRFNHAGYSGEAHFKVKTPKIN